jgi:predicted alpha/beta superfamily hydrolase
VLYLHDGQNVFTSADPGACFGWGDWGADRTADRLAVEGRAREVILVAIDNSPRRYAEYRGPAPGWRGGDDDSQTPHARYRRFLIEEVKPAIDRRFRTLTGPADTGILGSSMGGLCSLAIAWDHPEVFGLAGSLSGAFQVERSHFLRVVLGGHGGLPKPVRIYLDSGVVDHTGGDDGCANTRRVAAHLRRIGWRDGVDLLHFEDSPPLTTAQLRDTGLPESKWGEAQTSQHNEFYWRLRFGRALEFLFPAGPRA